MDNQKSRSAWAVLAISFSCVAFGLNSCATWRGYAPTDTRPVTYFPGWEFQTGTEIERQKGGRGEDLHVILLFKETSRPQVVRVAADSLRLIEDTSGPIASEHSVVKHTTMSKYDMMPLQYGFVVYENVTLPPTLTMRIYFSVVQLSDRAIHSDSLDFEMARGKKLYFTGGV